MKSYRREDYAKSAEKFWDSVLSRKSNMLSEMAIPLKMFVRDIEGLKFQIVQNWCLCKWCQMFDPKNANFNHWKKELASYLLQLQNSRLKGNISKKKQLDRYLIEYYEFNDKDVVVGAVRDKFSIEGISSKRQVNAVAYAFAKGISQLIDVISDNGQPIMAYIDKAFKTTNV